MDIKNIVILVVIFTVISVVIYIIFKDQIFQPNYECNPGESCVNFCNKNVDFNIEGRNETQNLDENFKKIKFNSCPAGMYEENDADLWYFNKVGNKKFRAFHIMKRKKIFSQLEWNGLS